MIDHHDPYADDEAHHSDVAESVLPTFVDTDEQLDLPESGVPVGIGAADPSLDGAAGLQLAAADGQLIEVGEPTLSSDGVILDSAVTYTDAGAEVYSDLDGDGQVDQIVRVGVDGHVTAWSTDAHGEWQVSGTGAIDPTGGISLQHPLSDSQSGPASETPAGEPPQVTVPGAAGTEFTGPATEDVDGDGVPDTVVVRSADGSVTRATDLDGDGAADRITVVTPDGRATVSQLDADGTWQVVTSGAPNPDGTISPQPADPVEPQPAPDDGPDTAAVPDGHLAVAGDDGGLTDLGEPKYDMNGDGAPDTVVVERDETMYQYSDTDGDGRADQLLRVHTADRTAEILQDHGHGWQVTVHGNIGDDGDFVPAGQQPSAGAEPAGHHDQHGVAPHIELTAPGIDGMDLGAPDQDLDGDGVAESVAVRAEDGHVLIVSDTDADGAADHLVDIDPDTGEAHWMTISADGEWTETQHGHVNADGALVVDGRTDGDDQQPADGPDRMANEDQVTVSVNGQEIPAGPATIDSDGDGVPDTVAVPGVGGSTQFYQDSTGDGVADRAWTVHADGTRSAVYVIEESGKWVQLEVAAGAGSLIDDVGH